MASNNGLIFLVTLMAGISFGNGASFKITKQDLLKINMKKVPENIKELVDRITLNETLTFWNKSLFHYCFNAKSVDFNLAVHFFVQELGKSLKNFMSVTNEENGLVQLCYNMVNENYKLMEQGRNGIYLETQTPDSVDRKLINDILPRVKGGLMLNFMGLDENFSKIRKRAHTNGHSKMWEEIENMYKTKVDNIKSESIKFVDDIKKCVDISKK